MNFISREKAKQQGLTRYFTGEPCKQGHIAERRTSTYICVMCAYENQVEWNKKNKEKRTEYSRQYRAKNKPKRCADQALRKTRKTKATPDWLTDQHKLWTQSIYDASFKLKQTYGVDCTVDHIVPIKGKNVCGLHVPWNLRLMDRKTNSQKKINLEENVVFQITKGCILMHESVLPWNLRKEQ